MSGEGAGRMTPTLLFVFVLVVSLCQAKVTRDKTGCPTDFEKKCSCGVTTYLGEDKYVVNCTNSGFTNADMLELLPEETQVLLFTGNTIRELPPNILGSDIDYNKLEVIDMTNNKIRHIRGQAFHRVSNVERLVLNHNDLYINGSHEHPRIFANMYNLKALHLTNAFTEYVDSKKYLVNLENIFFGSNLSKLEKLHLEQNEIWVIPNRDMFCQLPSLMDLYLGDNKLSVFDVDMGCLKHLRYVDLEGNKFNTFTKPVLRRFDALNERSETPFEINLSDNYFVCDCGITDFSDWLRTTQVKVRSKESLKCREGQPSSNAGAFVSEVHEATCLTEEARTGSDATAIVVVLLVTIMATLVAVVLYMNVTWVKNKTTDLVYMIKKRGAYTSLLTKPEEPEVNV